MKVGIIVAMDKEFELLTSIIAEPQTVVDAPATFVTGHVAGVEVIAMKCGIGKVNAAIGATLLIKRFAPDAVINTGVAGGGDYAVNVGDIVVGKQVAYHDVWCGPETELNAVQGMPHYYDAAPLLLKALPAEVPSIHVGLIASGDWFVDSLECMQAIKDRYPSVLAVDMESASLSQVCHVMGVPFMSLRVISDSPMASKDNTRDYAFFWDDAPRHTFEIVQRLLERL